MDGRVNGRSGLGDEGVELFWRMEMACRAAWPAAENVDLGGWVLRYSGNAIRRTGSLNPLPGAPALNETLLRDAEAFYAMRGHAALVRLLDFMVTDDGILLRRGYRREGSSRPLRAPVLNEDERIGAADEISEARREKGKLIDDKVKPAA